MFRRFLCAWGQVSLGADQRPYRRCCGNGRWLAAYGTRDSAVPGRIFFNTFYGNDLQCSMVGIMMMGFCRKGSTEIPFVPFLLAGYLGGIFDMKIIFV